MKLQLCTWQETEQYLKDCTGIIIPIGSTEQHGPNGLIGTDAICPEKIANGVAEVGLGSAADTPGPPVLVGPTINFGMAQHHLGFPGTIALRPSTLMALVKDIVQSLAGHGFTHIYFLNGHGGNTVPVKAGCSEFYADYSFNHNRSATSNMHTTIVNWWTLSSVLKIANELYPGVEGSHATPSEVSLTYYAYPEAVKDVSMTPEVATNGNIYDAAHFREHYPDGRMGSNPALASVADGERLYHAAVKEVAKDYQAFLQDF